MRFIRILVLGGGKLNLTVDQVKLVRSSGGSVAGTGGIVRWNKDEGVSYYRVEMVQSGNRDWSSPAYRFATQGGEAQLNNVTPGSYDMRVGALSKVSGRWEYTSPQSITVQ